MSSIENHVRASVPEQAAPGQLQPATWWEGLCGWLTTTLKGMEVTLERREEDGEWNVECLLRPLEGFATHRTPNGVQVLSIHVGMNGRSRVFEFAGADSVTLCRDPAGFPVRVEIRNKQAELLLCFSGPLEPQKTQTSNTWGE